MTPLHNNQSWFDRVKQLCHQSWHLLATTACKKIPAILHYGASRGIAFNQPAIA